MKGIFFQGSIFSRQIFSCKNFFPSKSVCGIFFFLKSPIPHHPSPPSKVKWSSPEVKVKAHRSYEVHRTGTWPSFCFFLWNETTGNGDLQIRGRERLPVQDLTTVFSAYSHNWIEIPWRASWYFWFTRKVLSSLLKEVTAPSRSHNDKTSNICFYHWKVATLTKPRSRMTTAITFSRQNDACSRSRTSIEKITYS